MLDWLLITTLGFLGSFGHCVGMCGPLTVAFSLSGESSTPSHWTKTLTFHILLNLGRVFSYTIIGTALGAVGSVVIASGQLAGVGSDLRQLITIITGLMLIWFGLTTIKPDFLPRLPILHPLTGGWHEELSGAMTRLSLFKSAITPLLLGTTWGLIPCGFLYAAQIKAAATGNWFEGGATMLFFGLGTMPTMLGIGVWASRLSANRRSQLFRLGGWITLTIGILTLLRNDAMVDYTGHGSLILLMLALIARPISRWWAAPLLYRRAIGVGAFVLAVAHTAHMLDHSLNWNLANIDFLLPLHRKGLMSGIIALLLLTPLALTSFNHWQKVLGRKWRQLHLLSIPALILAVSHALLIGSNYLGELISSWIHLVRTLIMILLTISIFLIRLRFSPHKEERE